VVASVVNVPEREPVSVSVDPEVWAAFREFVIEKHGKKRGELGREVENALNEYVDRDRYARIEERLDALEQGQDEVLARLPEERLHTHACRLADFEDLPPETRDGVTGLLANLEEGEVHPSDIKQAAMSGPESRGDDRTITKYREILESRGVLLPHPMDSGAWVHGEQRFALMCENNKEVSPERLDSLLGQLEAEDRFSTKDYRNALPEDYSPPLDIDEIRAGGTEPTENDDADPGEAGETDATPGVDPDDTEGNAPETDAKSEMDRIDAATRVTDGGDES